MLCACLGRELSVKGWRGTGCGNSGNSWLALKPALPPLLPHPPTLIPPPAPSFCPSPAGEALLRAGLLYLPDLDLYLAKVLAGPRYQLAAEFALHLVQQCVVLEPVVGAPDLAHTLDLLSKLATRVSGGNAVLQLVEEARRVSQ